MPPFLQIDTICGSKVGFETDVAHWLETKSYAQGATSFCNHPCGQKCPMYWIANMENYQEFMEALQLTNNTLIKK